jgi:hypothetical protein
MKGAIAWFVRDAITISAGVAWNILEMGTSGGTKFALNFHSPCAPTSQ